MNPEESKYTLEQIIARVQNLLTRADGNGTTPAEAALCRQHAERLMRVWRLKEENLLAVDPFSISPTHHSLFVAGAESDFYMILATLITVIANHSEVWIDLHWGRMNHHDSPYGIIATLVGFEVDLHQAEWLFSSARLAFGQHLEPTRDDTLSEQENVYRMRRAGMLRKDVALLMWGTNTPSLRSKAQRLYIRECEARGEQPQLEGLGTDAKTFREAYARGFVDRLSDRLRVARDAADSAGGVVTLAGRAQRIRDAFYELFPERRPTPATTDTTPAKKYRGPTKADMRRAERRYYSDAARAGAGEGVAAANQVEIKRPDPTLRIEG